MFYAYKENTLNGEISTTSVYISVNNNTNLIFFRFFLSTVYPIWDELSQKTISRYCPFKDGDDLGQVSSFIIKMALTTAGLLPDCSRAVEWAGGQHLEI